MRDLLEAMGIQKGSFYDTYGSKKAAYLASLERYAGNRGRWMQGLVDPAAPRASLERILRAIAQDCASDEGSKGCMAVNGALELAHEDEDARAVVLGAFRANERLFADLVRAARATGEMGGETDARDVARSLMSYVIGMRVYSRAGAPRSSVQALLREALRRLDD